jgi:hypothetical protein
VKTRLIALFVILYTTLFSQNSTDPVKGNPRSFRKFGVGIQGMGPTIIGSIYLNYFATHNINIELGTGLFGTYGGAKYYLGKKENEQLFSPYTGINIGTFKLPDPLIAIFGGDLAWKRVYSVNIPLGVQLMTKNGFNFSVEGSILFIDGSTTTGIPIKVSSPWGAIRIAKNF